MPAIASGKVLVTGANGYLAIYVVKTLLEAGFSVRGTVRSADQEPYLKRIFALYGDKLEIVVVKDTTKDGAFDDAVKSVDAIEHIASPFHFHGNHPDDLIVPAVAGTRSILDSILKFGTAVKRIVVTSSLAAIDELYDEPRVFTEEDWNNQSVNEVREKGSATSHSHVYRASKTLAEREAWQFVRKHNTEIKWDLVVLNPPWVYGPSLQDITSLSKLNASMILWYQYVLEGKMDKEALATEGYFIVRNHFECHSRPLVTRGFWVDIRDVSAAHVKVIIVEQAGGHRILTAAGSYKGQDWLNVARKFYPALPAGNTSYNRANVVPVAQLKSDKFEKLLGLKYHTMEETSKAIFSNVLERGLWDGTLVQ